jgi:hypothetical protein
MTMPSQVEDVVIELTNISSGNNRDRNFQEITNGHYLERTDTGSIQSRTWVDPPCTEKEENQWIWQDDQKKLAIASILFL